MRRLCRGGLSWRVCCDSAHVVRWLLNERAERAVVVGLFAWGTERCVLVLARVEKQNK